MKLVGSGGDGVRSSLSEQLLFPFFGQLALILPEKLRHLDTRTLSRPFAVSTLVSNTSPVRLVFFADALCRQLVEGRLPLIHRNDLGSLDHLPIEFDEFLICSLDRALWPDIPTLGTLRCADEADGLALRALL